MTPQSPLIALVAHARERLAEHHGQIARCCSLLSPAQVWHRSNAHTNSVGNLVLHLCGNVTQWVIGGLGGQQVTRDRPAEFAERGPLPTDAVVQKLRQTVEQADVILDSLDEPTLTRTYEIQGYSIIGAVAVFHVVEHFAIHTGQIVHMTKCLRDLDLSIYDEQGHKRPGYADAP